MQKPHEGKAFEFFVDRIEPMRTVAFRWHPYAVERVGRDRVWQLQAQRLEDASVYLTQISAQWDRALGRLRDFVEEKRT